MSCVSFAYKTMYPSNFKKFSTSSMEQPVGAPEIKKPTKTGGNWRSN